MKFTSLSSSIVLVGFLIIGIYLPTVRTRQQRLLSQLQADKIQAIKTPPPPIQIVKPVTDDKIKVIPPPPIQVIKPVTEDKVDVFPPPPTQVVDIDQTEFDLNKYEFLRYDLGLMKILIGLSDKRGIRRRRILTISPLVYLKREAINLHMLFEIKTVVRQKLIECIDKVEFENDMDEKSISNRIQKTLSFSLRSFTHSNRYENQKYVFVEFKKFSIK